MSTVIAKEATGWSMSIMQLFGSGPKWTVLCGYCDTHFTVRLPMVDRPHVRCTHCGTTNIVPVTV